MFLAVFVGDKLASKIPMKLVHSIAAAIFALLGPRCWVRVALRDLMPCTQKTFRTGFTTTYSIPATKQPSEARGWSSGSRATHDGGGNCGGLVVQLHGLAGRWLAHEFARSGHWLVGFAYATARRYAQDPRFAFGTWKIEILGGFASAIFLVGVAVMMLVGSVERIVAATHPVS